MLSKFLIILCAALVGRLAFAVDLQRTSAFCGAPDGRVLNPSAGAAKRLVGSYVAQGQIDIAWAWLESPTQRYIHHGPGGCHRALRWFMTCGNRETGQGILKYAALRYPQNFAGAQLD